MPVFTITLFTQKFPIFFCKRLILCKMFLFDETGSLVVFSEYSFVNLPVSLQYSFSYNCKWLLLNTSSMISSLKFLNLKESVPFVQNTTIGFWEKMIAQLRKTVPENLNEHTCDYLCYVSLQICLRWSIVWFWGMIRQNTS